MRSVILIVLLAQALSFADVARPGPGAWPTYNGNPSGNRFSPLDQINVTTIHSLAPKWMFTIQGAPRPLQTTPIVVDGVMYVTSVNEAYALDARTGRAIWHYSRPRTPGLAGDAATGINRGAAALGDRVFMVTDNAHLIALSRDKGELLWDVEMADSRQNYGATGAPLVVSVGGCKPATEDCDLVIAGVSGGDEGVRGFLDAYRASTGARAWRFWTVPAPGEPGSETWIGRAIEHGCAATWLTGTYDPESHLLYWPTGNPCPDYNGDERKGDNLYSASCWRSTRKPAGCGGTISSRRTISTTGTRTRRRCSSTRAFTATRASCSSRAIATVSSMCSIV
jgi:alcohol dehydrogenase (cytochrome c)